MLVSLKWLKDYVDVEMTPTELADALTMAGLEVDEIKQIKPAFTGVVSAEILSVKPHPSADKLCLCAVTDSIQTYPIVCGAKNIKAGDIVPLAKVGATIPGGYTIKSTVLRGEKSDGMLCSEEELEVGDDNTGIMQLPPGTALGKPLEEILVRDITTAARTGYATFYRHYATKDALLADLGRQQVLFLVETSLPVLDNQNFLAAFTVLFGHVNEHRAVWTTLLNGGAAHAIKQELLRVALAVALERVQGIDRAALELRVILIVTCLVEVLLWW
ncbi:MAG TPA: hypothetical protein PKO34_07210, partial [Smithellaceae bacterium]|nr:hypothetical protein [Smithellaceae bacterium]